MNEPKPRLVKIPWKMIQDDEDDPETQYHMLDTDIWFKHAFKAVRYLNFHQWGINGPELGRGLSIVYDDNFSISGLPLNRCIVDVTGGSAGHKWCGNVLALRTESSYSYNLFGNVDMQEDLEPLVKYFEEYGQR